MVQLKNTLVNYCNHLLATTVIYLTIVDPIQELANSLDKNNKDIIQEQTTNNNDEQITYRNYLNHYSQRLRVLVSASEADNSNQDYYEILGVGKDATKHDIHKAFRQLAKIYHPDKNKDKDAQDKFIKIFKAYETLSDEKKRKEYDDRLKSSGYGSYTHGGGSWQSTNTMSDFDVNEFFKQYEDQFLKHAQYFQHQKDGQHHSHNHNHNHGNNHEQFSYHGVNMDDLFHDIDEDEFQSFGRMFDFGGLNHNHMHHSDSDGTFGDHASFFGTHFPNQIHDTIHQYQQSMHHHHQHNHQQSGGNRQAGGAGYSCQTVTKQVNGMVMTQTSCM